MSDIKTNVERARTSNELLRCPKRPSRLHGVTASTLEKNNIVSELLSIK